MERKLVAILSVDVVGYTRLMERDEAGTLASVVDALTCAIAWQKGVADREMPTDKDEWLIFRIGINLGT